MTVKDLAFDVAFRLGNEIDKARAIKPAIIRAMNRVYHDLNRKTNALVKELEMDFSTLDPLVQYWSVPTDYVKAFRIEPVYVYKHPDEMNLDDEELNAGYRTFTQFGGKFYFANIADDTVITLWYYASGLTLVDKDGDAAASEAKSPEWPWEHIHEILLYGTAIELSNEYPMYQEDRLRFEELKIELFKLGAGDQDITTLFAGGSGTPGPREDDYGEY